MYDDPSVVEVGEKIDAELLGILRCPASGAKLVQAGAWLYSTDPVTRRKYPIRDGIPVLIVSEGVEASVEEFERVVRGAKNGNA